MSGEWGNEPLQKGPPAAGDGWGNDPVQSGPPQMSRLQKFGAGLMDPIEGGAQLLTHVLPHGVVEAVDAANNWIADKTGLLAPIPPGGMDEHASKREADIQAQHGDTWERMIGEMLSPVTLATAPMGAVTGGAVTGGMMPVTDGGNFWKEKTEQAAAGAAGGKLGEQGAKVAGAVIAPSMRKSAQLLADLGINLTPGQMLGGVVKRAEDSLSSVPVVGSLIGGAQRKSVEDFNKAALNEALKPIGESLPKDVPVGRNAIEVAQQKASDHYGKILSGVTLKADQHTADDLRNLRTLVDEMPAPQAAQFNTIVRNRVLQRLQPTGTMDGETYKQVEGELTTLAAPYRASPDAAQKQLGTAINEVKAILRDTLERSNPSKAGQIAKANEAYAMLSRVEEASSNRSTEDGVFSPADLLKSVRGAARRTGRMKAFARGDAHMQEFAEAAQGVLPQRVPNSGTPERALWAALVGGSPAVVSPWTTLGVGAASLPYTRPGMAAARAYASPGATRQAVGDAVSRAGRYVAPDAAVAALQALGIAP